MFAVILFFYFLPKIIFADGWKNRINKNPQKFRAPISGAHGIKENSIQCILHMSPDMITTGTIHA